MTTATAAALTAAHQLLELCMGAEQVSVPRDAVRSWTLDVIEALTPDQPECQHSTITKTTYDAGWICTEQPSCHHRFWPSQPYVPRVLSGSVLSLSVDTQPNAFHFAAGHGANCRCFVVPVPVPESRCMVPGPDVVHEPHEWWHTTSGGGHQLSGPDPDERDVRKFLCPGVEAPILAVCPECQQGKCGNCDSTAWDHITDTPTACSCTHPSLPDGPDVGEEILPETPEPRCPVCRHPAECHTAKGGCTVPVDGPNPRCGCAEASRISEVTR